MPKESKQAKDAQEENKWDTGARNQCNENPNDHIEPLREELAAGPKRPSKLGSNNITAGMTELYGKKWQQDYRKE